MFRDGNFSSDTQSPPRSLMGLTEKRWFILAFAFPKKDTFTPKWLKYIMFWHPEGCIWMILPSNIMNGTTCLAQFPKIMENARSFKIGRSKTKKHNALIVQHKANSEPKQVLWIIVFSFCCINDSSLTLSINTLLKKCLKNILNAVCAENKAVCVVKQDHEK